jgi:hypothetical protein
MNVECSRTSYNSHQDFDYLLIRAAVADGAKGIVIAGKTASLRLPRFDTRLRDVSFLE